MAPPVHLTTHPTSHLGFDQSNHTPLSPLLLTFAAPVARKQMSLIDGLSHDAAGGSGNDSLQSKIRPQAAETADSSTALDDGRHRTTRTFIVQTTALSQAQSDASVLAGIDRQTHTATRSSSQDSLPVPIQAEPSVLTASIASTQRFVTGTDRPVEESAVVSETASFAITNTTLPASTTLSATPVSTQTPLPASGVSATTIESIPPTSTVPDDIGQITTLSPTPATIFSGMGMNVETSWMSVSTAANNRAAANNPSSEDAGIFVPGHKLFPLGITVIVLGGLFILFTLGILLVRLCGWNRKRRLRRALPSFIEVDPNSHNAYGSTTADTMFEPKFETITTNMASTDPFVHPSDRSGRDEWRGRRSSRGEGYASVGTYGAYQVQSKNQPYSDATAWNDSYDPSTHRPAPPRNDFNANPFLNPPSSTGPLGVPVDVDAGSPVPSFETGRIAYGHNPSYNDTAGIHHAPRGDHLAYNDPRGVGRSLTTSSNSSDRPHRSNTSARHRPPEHTGVPAQVSQYAGTTRYARRSNGSIGTIGPDSVFSNSSSEIERVLWDPRLAAPHATGSILTRKPTGDTFATPHHKLEKPAMWSSSRV